MIVYGANIYQHFLSQITIVHTPLLNKFYSNISVRLKCAMYENYRIARLVKTESVSVYKTILPLLQEVTSELAS
jgi:hypothetical protein